MLVLQLDKLIRQIDLLIRQAPDPTGAATWVIRELAGRTGLRVVVLGPKALPSERVSLAGSEALDALRMGLADDGDEGVTLEAAKALVDSLGEEMAAFEMGVDWDGTTGVTVSTLTSAWGEQAPRCHR